MTPFRNSQMGNDGPGLTGAAKRNYNKTLSSAGVVIEHLFGVLKGRFRRLNIWRPGRCVLQGDPKKKQSSPKFETMPNLLIDSLYFFQACNTKQRSTSLPSLRFEMPWTTEEKTFIVEAYFRLNSINAAQSQFKKRFQCRECPAHSLIYSWVHKFRSHGTVNNLNRKDPDRQSHSGRPKSSRSPHNVAAVRESVVRSPSKSVRRRSQELGIARESVRRILITDLQLYPYRIQIKQKLTPDDMKKRVTMCQWFCDKIDHVPDFLDDVWFSDEAHFLLSGHVNSKNSIFWGSTSPEHCLQRPLHSVKCTAWVAISKHGIIGPIWFEDDNERSVTINTERYVQVLREFWTALGRRRGVVRALQWFQQDGATPHTSNESLAWLRQRFPDRLISRRCDPEWSPHSPDLNRPYFYLWGT